jgi:hypothetical protein
MGGLLRIGSKDLEIPCFPLGIFHLLAIWGAFFHVSGLVGSFMVVVLQSPARGWSACGGARVCSPSDRGIGPGLV